jgi:EAL domain-containing protein (putative c-di-GMP-specific phosphodiesterase class I)
VIEHFGTGYTSIRHLGRFPIQGIRLDKSIINNVPNDSRSCDILNAIIQLAHQLDLEVTTEGVESTEQLNYLTSINCDAAAGYLLSYPLEADKIIHSLNYSEIQTKT